MSPPPSANAARRSRGRRSAASICPGARGADRPDLAVILNASPPVIAARLVARGRHSRFERQHGSSQAESGLYHDTAARLADAGWSVCCIDVTTRSARETAMILTGRILALHADANRSSHDPCQPVPADVQHR
jgi:thymidylate kinase